MFRIAQAAALLAATALSSVAQAEGAPAFKPDRTAEDYSYLRGAPPAERKLKFIALDPAATAYVSLGGELKTRVEAVDAPRFGIGAASDSYLLQRLLLHADYHPGPNVRVFVQLGVHEAVGKKVLGAADEDHFDLHQLLLDVRPAEDVVLRLGRQELAFNPAQRFVNYRETSNVRLSFDGARATLQLGPNRLDAFAVQPVATERGVLDDKPNDDAVFGGLYAARKLPGNASVDIYWFWLNRDDVRFGSAAGDEDRHSFGVRTAGSYGAFDWDVEAMVQRGSFADQDIRAWGGGGEIGYAFRTGMKPRLALRLDTGSGDDRSADRKLNTFNPLFPRAAYLSEAALMSFSNLVSVRASLGLQPAAGVQVEGSVALNRREDVDDAVYTAPSTPIAATRASRSAETGAQYSLNLKWQANRHVLVQSALIRHSAGNAIEAAGGRAVEFAMFSLQTKF